MPRRKLGFAVVGTVAVLAGVVAIAPVAGAQRGQVQAPAVAAVRAGIDSAFERFMGYAKAGNTAAMALMYAEDASLVEPAGTISGRAAIEKGMRDWWANATYFGRTRSPTSFDIGGDVVVETGTFTEAYQERGKKRAANQGRYLIVWRRAGGTWVVQRDVELPNSPMGKR